VRIIDVIQQTLPYGTRPTKARSIPDPPPLRREARNSGEHDDAWRQVPLYPTDCFAVVSQLLEESGAYHHIRAVLPQAQENRAREIFVQLLKQFGIEESKRQKLMEHLHEPAIWDLLTQLLKATEQRQRARSGANFDLDLDYGSEDTKNWTLRLSTEDETKWIKIGRAWSLMLPFATGAQRKAKLLTGAREWLKSTASLGHDPIWFHKPWLSDAMVRAIEQRLGALNDAAMKAGDGRIAIDVIEECFGSIVAKVQRRTPNSHGHPYEQDQYLSEALDAADRELVEIGDIDLQKEWETIWSSGDKPVITMRSELGPRYGRAREMPRWWSSALKLMIASDEACIRIGTLAGEYFDMFRLGAARAGVAAYLSRIAQSFPAKVERKFDLAIDVNADIDRVFGNRSADGFWFDWSGPAGEETLQHCDDIRNISFTFSGISNYNHVCIFPKNRMPSGGNTIRNLSNNLALLPSRGVSRANLRRGEEKPLRRAQDLNLLLVPFPYRISASAFQDAGPAQRRGKSKWRWFDLEQNWLHGLTGDHLTNAIDILCLAAAREVDKIDGIIFPELALNYDLYAKLALYISQRHPSVEIFIAGTSERPDREKIGKRAEDEKNLHRDYERTFNQYSIRLSSLANVASEDLRKGNFVGTTSFLRYSNSDVTTYLMTFQQKHHRWRLDESQIARYGIWKQLDPQYYWWENLETATRNIEFMSFRGGSTLVSLICEDLARLEPCQQLIRAIGPNLVVALLLDGPQRTDRWSARYATVLADDPGSSVLCLTSMGLMARSTDRNTVNSKCIGLWKDDTGVLQEIHLPDGAHAAVLKLAGERREEFTMDGRDNANLAISWRYKGCIPIHDTGLIQPLPPEFLGKMS
jgi:hypothetical protein